MAVVEVGCHGQCARAPLVLIEPQDYLYGGVRPEDVDEIVERTLREGQAGRAALRVGSNGQLDARPWRDIPFSKNQRREVLGNCGRVDPRRIEDAIARGAYAAAAKVLTGRKPQEVIDEVTASGLRGRGGAGFPTGIKWNLARKSAGTEKYLICNADEGDPGAFMDRALLEGDPHAVIEGMIIGAYAIGASHGFVYVRAEYPIAVEHVGIALEQARAVRPARARTSSAAGFSLRHRSADGRRRVRLRRRERADRLARGPSRHAAAAAAVPRAEAAISASRPASTTSRPSGTCR